MKSVYYISILLSFTVSCLCMTNSKLSIFTAMGTNSWEIVNEGQPRLILLFDNFDPAVQIKQTVPGIVIVGRIYLDNQPQDGDPTQAAQYWWSECGSTILQYPAIDYWEGYNEPYVGDLASMQWYNQFEVARVQIMAQNGVKAAIGNFATGTPDVTNPAIIQAFYPAIYTAMQNNGNNGRLNVKLVGILALHEYSAPYMQTDYTGTTQDGTGWLTGRYRMLYNNYLIPNNYVIPLVVAENGNNDISGSLNFSGIDGGVCPSTGCDISGGWQNFCGYWSSNGAGSDCNTAYMQQLAWYDQVMQADSYVIGSTIFCLEIYGWESFDIAPLTSDLIAYMRAT